jgi:hypothetical protein
MEDVVIDRPVAIVCSGHGTHAVRELVVLVPVRPRSDLALMHKEAGLPPPTPHPFEARGFGVEESRWEQDGWSEPVERHKSEARLIDAPGVGWQVIHKGCPSCRSPLVLQVAHVAAVLAQHPQHARRLELDVRPA